MSATFEGTEFSEGLAARLAGPRPSRSNGVSLFWLGQAGFLIETDDGYRILIDPYLSDFLGLKYAGGVFSHERMMAPPVEPDRLGAVDLVLCTHRHTDHMDPGTLRPLGSRRPHLRFVVPAAEIDEAKTRTGVGGERLLPIDAGESIEPLPGLRIRAVRAAHETLETDEHGRHRFLGFAVESGGVTVFHSGDTVPYLGQAEEVAALKADLALLPVNGRSATLTAAGIPGNMTEKEALALAQAAAIPAMLAHHYGMFAFNTADPDALDDAFAVAPVGIRAQRARLGVEYRLEARATD